MPRTAEKEGKAIRCSGCNTFLCVETDPGLFLFKRSHGRSNHYELSVTSGAIKCHKCGVTQPIPPFEALKPQETGGKHAT